MDASSLQFDAADPMAWRDRLVEGAAPETVRLAAVSQEFEAVLLRQYLSEALKPVTKDGGLFAAGNQVYGYLITDALARSLSGGSVFGFSTLMQAQLAGALENHENESDLL